ncbi:dienelactone hydrolase family protein [Maricaulis sp. MIT060901]|uniref:dienelactone hydrolase family protein n=1 Tax=Maricaulis sp. MIT060901 TaxID=3096993 RepID=UPI00399AB4DC
MFMRKLLSFALAGAAMLVGVLLLAYAVNLTHVAMPRRTVEQQVALLRAHTEIRLPEAASEPVPVVVMLHGCGGRRQVQDDYANAVVEAGYAALIINSNEARDIGRFGSMSQVCLALRLLGQERAADIHAGLKIAAEHPGLDQDQVALLGWSHGGWTILDALTFAGRDQYPNALKGVPDGLPGVQLALAMYPYCGFPALADGRDLPADIPLHAILAEDDVIAPANRCERRLERGGAHVSFEIYEGQTHAFDEPNAPPLDPRIVYNENAAAQAQRRIVDLLDERFSQP